jgi:4-hydroxy-tetrahydrodipicolinate synthase
VTKFETPVFATITPFDKSGFVDDRSLERYLRFLSAAGVGSILSGGTTGEFSSLTLAERMHLLELHRSYSDATIFQNISCPAVADAVLLASHARGIAQGVVLLPPYYFAGASQDGIYKYFSKVLTQIEMPTMLYNFPRHVGSVIEPETYARIASNFPQVIGLKDSSGELDSAQEFHSRVQDGQIYVGGDSHAFDVLEMGLAGSVTGAGNAFPEFLISLTTSYQSDNSTAARKAQTIYNQWNQARRETGVPEIMLVKGILSHRIEGFCDIVRPPFVSMSEADRSAGADPVSMLLSLGLSLLRELRSIKV